MNNFLTIILVSFVIFVLQDLAGARPPGNMTTLAWWFNGALVGFATNSIVKIWN